MDNNDITRAIEDVGGEPLGHGWWKLHTDDIENFAVLVAAAEREACALLCDNLRDEWGWDNDGEIAARDCANAIRERGE